MALALGRKKRGQQINVELNQRLYPDMDYLFLNQLVAGYYLNIPLVERSRRSTLTWDYSHINQMEGIFMF
jgi:hypothetical protein